MKEISTMLGFRSLWQRWFGDYAAWRVRRRAVADALRFIPAWDSQEQPPFLKTLLSAGRQSLRTLVRDWHQQDEGLKNAWLAAEKDIEHAQTRMVQADEKADLACDQFKEVHGHEPATIQTAGRGLRYWLLLVVLAVLEFPINSIVYRGLHQNEVETRIIAGGIGLLLAAVAHALGRLLRQTNKTGSQILFAVALPSLTLALVAGVGYMRAAYMQHAAGSDQQWSPAIIGAVFLVMNALLFTVATVAAYHHYEAFAGDVAKTACARKRAQATLNAAEKALSKARATREKRFEFCKEDALATAEEVTRVSGLYWIKNLERRADRDRHASEYPSAYSSLPMLEIPQELSGLEWEKPGGDLAGTKVRDEGRGASDPLMAELRRATR
jgi:hypothetical protein